MDYADLMNQLKNKYLTALTELIIDLQQQLNVQDWESIESEFHKLKGNGSTYGIPEISMLGAKLEVICASNSSVKTNLVATGIVLLQEIVQQRSQGKVFALQDDPRFQSLSL